MAKQIRKNPLIAANRCIDKVSKETDSCILMCSLGKDSIVTLDLIYPHFKRIVCVFMYFVKGLSHIERWISWVRNRYPNVEFVQVPHFSLSYVLKYGTYCTPHPKQRVMNLNKVVTSLRLKTGIKYVFLGMKICDSMNRNLMIKRMAPDYVSDTGMCYPLAEFTQKQILAYMRMKHLPKPVMYGQAQFSDKAEVGSASNGISLNLDCFLWLRKYAPDDLEKIYKVFPLSRRILFEYDFKHKEESLEDNQSSPTLSGT